MSIQQRLAGVGLALLLACLMIGCGGTERNTPEDPAGAAIDGQGNLEPGAAASTAALESEKVVLFVGTSLTAGQGVSPEESFPVLIEQMIEDAGLPYRVVNAGVSGETSAGALGRIDWLLRQDFDVIVLETGANDMLRGVDPQSTEANVQAIIDRIRATHPDVRIVLAGMLALPNLGREYGDRFAAIYPRLAERNGATLIPFLLEGVAAERDLNQGDGMHPNPVGHRIVAETVWETLRPVLQ